MNLERPIVASRNGSANYAVWTDLSPTQVGLAAALKRAFEAPADETSRKFEELISQLR